MGTKPSIFQPGHDGKHTAPTPRGRVMSMSHNDAAALPANGDGMARRSTTGKHIRPVEVHGAMVSQSEKMGAALGGDHKSYLDSVSGTIVPGTVTATPGYGNSGLTSGHPFERPPASKRPLYTPRPVIGQRSRVGETFNGEPGQYHRAAMARDQDHALLHLTGGAVIAEGLAAAPPDDPARMANRKLKGRAM